MKTRSSPDKPKRDSLLKKVSEVSKDTDPDDTSDSIETPFPKNTPGNLTGAANSSIQHSAENSDIMESKMLI